MPLVAVASVNEVAPLLSKSIADRYSSAIADLAKIAGVEVLSGTASSEGFGVEQTLPTGRHVHVLVLFIFPSIH